MIAIWCANVDFHPVVSMQIVLNYISKYVAKSKEKSKNYLDMLKRLENTNIVEDRALVTYQKFMMNILVERDISTQEMCHMLQKMPLLTSSQRMFI